MAAHAQADIRVPHSLGCRRTGRRSRCLDTTDGKSFHIEVGPHERALDVFAYASRLV
jgi:hypothetical protein